MLDSAEVEKQVAPNTFSKFSSLEFAALLSKADRVVDVDGRRAHCSGGGLRERLRAASAEWFASHLQGKTALEKELAA